MPASFLAGVVAGHGAFVLSLLQLIQSRASKHGFFFIPKALTSFAVPPCIRIVVAALSRDKRTAARNRLVRTTLPSGTSVKAASRP